MIMRLKGQSFPDPKTEFPAVIPRKICGRYFFISRDYHLFLRVEIIQEKIITEMINLACIYPCLLIQPKPA